MSLLDETMTNEMSSILTKLIFCEGYYKLVQAIVYKGEVCFKTLFNKLLILCKNL